MVWLILIPQTCTDFLHHSKSKSFKSRMVAVLSWIGYNLTKFGCCFNILLLRLSPDSVCCLVWCKQHISGDLHTGSLFHCGSLVVALDFVRRCWKYLLVNFSAAKMSSDDIMPNNNNTSSGATSKIPTLSNLSSPQSMGSWRHHFCWRRLSWPVSSSLCKLIRKYKH